MVIRLLGKQITQVRFLVEALERKMKKFLFLMMVLFAGIGCEQAPTLSPDGTPLIEGKWGYTESGKFWWQEDDGLKRVALMGPGDGRAGRWNKSMQDEMYPNGAPEPESEEK